MTSYYKVYQTIVFPFTESGGNPAPIVVQAGGLSTEGMQQISKFYNLESGFVIKQNDQKIKLRYFVPNYEMEMCLHATVGSLAVLTELNLLNYDDYIIETKIGSIKAESRHENNKNLFFC